MTSEQAKPMSALPATAPSSPAGVRRYDQALPEFDPQRSIPRFKVLMVIECAGAGTGRHVLETTAGLLNLGVDDHMIYSTNRVDALFKNGLANIPQLKSHAILMTTNPSLKDFGVVKQVKRYMREHGPFDIIHGHSSKGGAIARLAKMGTKSKAVYTLHGMTVIDPTISRPKRALYWVVENILARFTSRIIAVSPEEARSAVKIGFGKKRVVLAPNGVGNLNFTPREIARQKMQLQPQHIAIGFVGRIVDQKAPHILVECFANTCAKVPNARLVLVGDGPLVQPLKDLGQKLGVLDKMFFCGEIDARTVFTGFDIFAISSRKEGLPYVVLEALAAGKPVVATDSSCVEILIESDVNGYIVPMDDVACFSESLIKLASNPEMMARFGTHSLQMAKDFTIDAMVRRTITAYGQVMGW